MTGTKSGNCHRTPGQKYQNVAFRVNTPHIGECRKCGKPFIRKYVSEQEYDAWWQKYATRRSNMELLETMPVPGWSEWVGWAPTHVQYLIQEQP